MISLGEALKATRRGIHVYGEAWRTLVVASPRHARYLLHDDILPILQGSSLGVEHVNNMALTIRTEKGGHIRVCMIDDYLDALRVAGHRYTQIIWTHTPSKSAGACRDYVNACLRSPTVPPEALRTDDVAL